MSGLWSGFIARRAKLAPQRGGRQIAQGVAPQAQTLGRMPRVAEPRRGVQKGLRSERHSERPSGAEFRGTRTQGLPSFLGLHPGLSAGCPSGAMASPADGTGWQPALPGVFVKPRCAPRSFRQAALRSAGQMSGLWSGFIARRATLAPQRGGRQIAQGVATQAQTLGRMPRVVEPRRGVQKGLRSERHSERPSGAEFRGTRTQGLPSFLGLHPGLSAGCPSGARASPADGTGWQPALPGVFVKLRCGR
jgi:hypothetical protein